MVFDHDRTLLYPMPISPGYLAPSITIMCEPRLKTAGSNGPMLIDPLVQLGNDGCGSGD